MAASDSTRLGFIVPSTNYVVEPDLYRTAPPSITVHFARVLIRERRLTEAGYPKIWDESNRQLWTAVEQLASANVSTVAYAVTAGSFYGGRLWEERLRSRLEARFAVPATTTAYALIQGLDTLRARRISLATAYSSFLNNGLVRFLAEWGIETLACEGLGNTVVQQPAEADAADVLELVRRVVRAETEAIVISCAGLSVLNLIDGLESEHGVPVVTSNQAVLWSSMRAAGLSTKVTQAGVLLQEH